jgi:guanylate kinase
MTFQIQRRGLMLVLSSPSGAGKTTLSRRLLERDSDLSLSVSATTRPARPGEVDGADYIFVTAERFDEMVAGGELLEHAVVFGHKYGTPKAPVERALADGQDVLFDIDWQGTQQLKQEMREDLVERRLYARAQDSEEVVRGRMAKAADEMSHWAEYDYIVVNENVEDSLDEVKAILTAERLRRQRRVGLHEFVERLRGGG